MLPLGPPGTVTSPLHVKEHRKEENGGVLMIKIPLYAFKHAPTLKPSLTGWQQWRDAVFMASVSRSADKPGLYLEAQCVI